MANDIITNLHPDNDPSTILYPNIKKQNIPNKSIDINKLDDNVLSLIGSLKPSGTDTSTNILAYTSNKGIYVATDNGHWYYWNGTQYVDGGLYITDPSYDELREDLDKLESDLDYHESINLFDNTSGIEGKGRQWNTGTLIDNANTILFDFIPVEPNRKLYFTRGDGKTTQGTNAFTMWTKDKEYIGNYTQGNNLPSNCYYISLTVSITNFNTYKNSLILQYDIITPYTPYYKSYYFSVTEKQYNEINNRTKRKYGIISIAHQGDSTYAPNQTMAAFKDALNNRFDYVECDLQITSDGKYVCCHNDIVYADTTNKIINQTLAAPKGEYTTAINIANTTLAELKSYSWGKWKSIIYENETIVTLEELINWCKINGMKLVIDHFYKVIENETLRNEVFDMIDNYGMRENVIIVSLHPAVVEWYSKVKICYSLVTFTQENLNFILERQTWFPNAEISLSLEISALTTEICKTMHQHNIKVYPWVIDNVELYEQWIPYVDGIFSNKISNIVKD